MRFNMNFEAAIQGADTRSLHCPLLILSDCTENQLKLILEDCCDAKMFDLNLVGKITQLNFMGAWRG